MDLDLGTDIHFFLHFGVTNTSVDVSVFSGERLDFVSEPVIQGEEALNIV